MFFAASLILLLILIPATGSAQEDSEKQERQPEIKWDVQRHFDETGNLIWFDSTYSWSWSNHDFGNMDFDSLFWGPSPSMPHTSVFPDAFIMPPDFDGFNHLFPVPDPGVWSEQHKELFDRYREMFEHFQFMDPFHDDSLQNFQYKQRYQQGDQKKSGREVEI